MKKLILVLMFLLIGCGPADPPSKNPVFSAETEVRYGVVRFIDEEAGVVCWLSDVYYGNDISCLPISETLLDAP